MRNILKLVVVGIVVLVGIFAFSTRQSLAKFVRASDSRIEIAVSPRSIYSQNCARCHGADGKSQTALGQKLEAADLTTGDVKGLSSDKMTRRIKNGRGAMPSFAKKLTAAQVVSVIRYVRSL